MRKDNNTDTFLELVRRGLWGDDAGDFNANINLNHDKADWDEVYWLSQGQSVAGVVLAGIEHSDVKPSQELLLQWIGEVQMLEQQNKAMNAFVAKLIEKLKKEGVFAILVKGQGVAQCYEKPLWRSCGDVDLLLDEVNYEKAKKVLLPICGVAKKENATVMHFPLEIESWTVELHGTLNTGLSSKIDKEQSMIQEMMFEKGEVRTWKNGKMEVYLPSADNDVIFIFSHFIKHFYKGGLGLRQICDWCRLLYTYKDSLNYELLEQRIKRAGLMSEWQAFATLAVEYLGMPVDAMPFLDVRGMKEDGRCDIDKRLRRKADRIMEFVLKSGNMGHNRDMSHFSKTPYFVRKCISMGRRIGDLIHHARIFPLDSLRFFPTIMLNGVRSAMRGE